MPAPFLSVIIPAYNESGRIIAALRSLSGYLLEQSFTWEVITVDDGSEDDTAEIVEQWCAENDRFRLERIPHAGKGAAVRHGMLVARGEYRFMCDADLAMPIDHLSDFLRYMSEGNDMVIGSRQIAGREPLRRTSVASPARAGVQQAGADAGGARLPRYAVRLQVLQRGGGRCPLPAPAHQRMGLRCRTALSGKKARYARSGNPDRLATRRRQQAQPCVCRLQHASRCAGSALAKHARQVCVSARGRPPRRRCARIRFHH